MSVFGVLLAYWNWAFIKFRAVCKPFTIPHGICTCYWKLKAFCYSCPIHFCVKRKLRELRKDLRSSERPSRSCSMLGVFFVPAICSSRPCSSRPCRSCPCRSCPCISRPCRSCPFRSCLCWGSMESVKTRFAVFWFLCEIKIVDC